MRRVVLASASPARLAVLRGAGIEPEVIVSGVDESGVLGTAAEVSTELAARKAAAVAGTLEDGLVIGCDSVLEFGGEIHGKPADAEVARARWARMAGRSGVLHTGHCVIDAATGRRALAGAATTVYFGTPDAEELAAYLASGEPMQVAGAFTLDGRCGPFVERIDGDHGTVLGLSLPLLRHLLAELGVRITDLWETTSVGRWSTRNA
jgi:septum formation protein